jgi:hypothetical protein
MYLSVQLVGRGDDEDGVSTPGRRAEGLAGCRGGRLRQRHQTEPVDYALTPLDVLRNTRRASGSAYRIVRS